MGAARERGHAELRPIHLVLRCMAWPEREGGSWQAVCIDLDLWAKGSSANDAHYRLRQAINGYMATVLDTKDVASIPRLIRRLAPLRYRALWHLVTIYRVVRPRPGSGPHLFTESPELHLGGVPA